MAEWAILVLLVPAVAIPVVLLMGFAGCDAILLRGLTIIRSAEATSTTSIAIAWQNDAAADSVKIEVTQVPDGTRLPLIDASSPHEITGLLPGTTYGLRLLTFFGDDAEPSPQSPFITTLSVAFDTVNDTGPTGDYPADGFCVIQRIEPVRLTASGTRVRILLRAPTASGASIERVYISQLGPGDPYDSADDLTRVFDVSDPPGQMPLIVQGADEIALPIVRYTFNAARPLLIAFDLTPGFASVLQVQSQQAADTVVYFQAGVQEANVEVGDRTTGYGSANGVTLVTRIEVG